MIVLDTNVISECSTASEVEHVLRWLERLGCDGTLSCRDHRLCANSIFGAFLVHGSASIAKPCCKASCAIRDEFAGRILEV